MKLLKKEASFLLLMLFISCVPAKRQTIMQERFGYSYAIPVDNNPKVYKEKVPEYRLQPGDVIRLDVTSLSPIEFNFFGDPSDNANRLDPLLEGFLVDKDGDISIPFVGDLLVRGLTIKGAQEKITEVLAQYLDTPTVIARLVSFHYTVLGEVNAPGKFAILEDRINILEAIGSARGLTQFANYEKIRVIRSDNGESIIGIVNFLDNNLPTSPYYYLQPNDVIVVDQLTNKNFRSNSAANLTLVFAAITTIVTTILAVDNLGSR